MTRVSASSGTRMLRGVDNDNRRDPNGSKIELYLDKKSCSVSLPAIVVTLRCLVMVLQASLARSARP